MTTSEFKQSLLNDQPPSLPAHLLALWYDGKGDWKKAHAQVDSLGDAKSCLVHAYLHRKEGDLANADYWYSRAGKTRPVVNLEQEWEKILSELL